MMSVSVETQSEFKPSRPKALFDISGTPPFTVTAKGDFLVLRQPETNHKAPLWLVENWAEELKQKVR